MLYWHAGSAIHWVKSSPPLRQALEWLLSGLKWNMVRVKIWQGISCGLCHQKEEEKLIHAFTIINLAVLDGCHVLWICINPIMSLSEFLPLRLAGIPCAHNALSCPLIFYHYSHYAAKKKAGTCCQGAFILAWNSTVLPSMGHHEYSFVIDFCFTPPSHLCCDFQPSSVYSKNKVVTCGITNGPC